jgi:nucleoside-diphosphate-sugar epimerase
MRALVIGSEGNIGAPLVRWLRAQGHAVFEADIRPGWRPDYSVADIANPIDLLPAFDCAPDVVFLLAALVGRMPCEQAYSSAIATNVMGVNNVVQLCQRSNSRLVFFSTSEVYGPETVLMTEDDPDLRPSNRYGLTKLLGEQIIRHEVRSGNLDAVILRLFCVYHEEETAGEHRSAMIRFVDRLSRGLPVEVHRKSERGWLHVSDAVKAIEAAALLPSSAIVNVGHPDIVGTERLVELIRTRLGARRELVRPVSLPERMTLKKRPDLSRMRELLNVVPRVSVAQGVDWLCARYAQTARFGVAEAPRNGAEVVSRCTYG